MIRWRLFVISERLTRKRASAFWQASWHPNPTLEGSRYPSHWICCHARHLICALNDLLPAWLWFCFYQNIPKCPLTCFQERKGYRQQKNVKEIIYVTPIKLLWFGHCYDALHMERDNGLNVHSTRKQIKCRCMGEQIRSMQWPLGRPCQPHLQGFIVTTILIQSNGCTP